MGFKSGGGGGVEGLNEGVALGNVTSINFAGAGVTAVLSGSELSVDIPGGAGAASVTSVEAQAISAQAASALSQALSVLSVTDAGLSARIDTQSQGISVVSNALSNEISNRTSADNVLSNAISAVSQALSVHSQANSVADAGLSVRIDTVSNAASTVSANLATLSLAVSVISQAVSVHSQLFSTLRGGAAGEVLQKSTLSDWNWKWTAIAAGAGSVTSTEVSAVSAQAASALSQALSVLSVTDAGLSVRIDTVSQGVSVVSNALSALDDVVSAISTKLSAVSALSVGGVAADGLQSAINALSNRISAIPGGASAPATRIKDVTALICVSTLTAIPSLSVSVSAGGLYRISACLMYITSAALTTAIGFGLRVSPAGTFLHATGVYNRMSAIGHSGGLVPGVFDQQALSVTDSILTSVPVISTDIARTKWMQLEMVGKVSASGTLTPTARTLVGTNTLIILPGSFIKAQKIS